jgi:chemotaxis protein histidine kinase CheA
VDAHKLLQSQAYKLFVEELDKHLAACEAVLTAQTARQAPLTTEERRKLSTAFHTIRGGAGFFALTDIAQTAKALEERLQQPALEVSPGVVEDDSVAVRALVQTIQKAASLLPRGE